MAQRMIDKFILLGCSTLLFYFAIPQKPIFVLLAFLLVFFLSVIEITLNNTYINLGIYMIFLAICCFFPFFSIFVPVILYEVEFSMFKWTTIFCILPFLFFWDQFSPIFIMFTALFLILSLFLSYKTMTIELLQKDYEAFRKTARELALVQEEKNKSILENQDYEIQNATLNERNRISKEIHDHVGHLLSRSLLQIGALLVVAKDEFLIEGLTDLKNSISEGMDTIRSSIHNMHDESIDLNQSIQGLIHGFKLCPVRYQYELRYSPPLKLRYCFLAITKEALSNMIKHGNDITEAMIDVTETEASYCLHIQDNGAVPEKVTRMVNRCQSRMEYPEGLGLQSIFDRVKSFQGNLTLHTNNGFELIITIPKET
ncbi:MAG: hypothetical protein PWP24_2019 [Clostridiales bacterium]|nr:hypothetical protein [Clostridiales bacterium]